MEHLLFLINRMCVFLFGCYVRLAGGVAFFHINYNRVLVASQGADVSKGEASTSREQQDEGGQGGGDDLPFEPIYHLDLPPSPQ